MDRNIAPTEDIDLEISVANITLGWARRVWTRCPVGENQCRVDEAEAEVNRLLDRRLASSRDLGDRTVQPIVF